MKRFLIILLFPIFSGCYFQEFHLINKNGFKERVFENLYQGSIWNGIDLKATIKAVYMNDVDNKSFKDDEIFFISLYIFDDLQSEEKRGIKNPFYSLYLNGQKPYRVEEVTEESELYEKISFSTNWFRNYLVYFYPVDSDNLQLKFEHNHFGKVVIQHTKGSGEIRDYPTVIEKLKLNGSPQ